MKSNHLAKLSSIILQVVGAATLIIILLVALTSLIFPEPDKFGTIEITQTKQSESGNTYSSIFTSMGGGAAGWCSQGVFIHPKSTVDINHEVFHKNTNTLIKGKCNAKFKINMVSDQDLSITITQPINGR